MAGLRTPEILSHERLGHQLGGIGARYSHVTPEMRRELLEQLTQRWEREQALDPQAAIADGSPVPALDALLRERHAGGARTKIFSQDSPKSPREGVVNLFSRPRKGA